MQSKCDVCLIKNSCKILKAVIKAKVTLEIIKCSGLKETEITRKDY